MTTWQHWQAICGSLIFGILAGWLAASIRTAKSHARASALAARGTELEIQMAKLEESLAVERDKNATLGTSLATVQSENSHLTARLNDDARRIAEMQERMKLEFENLAGRLLEEKSARFLEQNHQHLGTLLNPLRERLGEFRERMEKIHTEEEKSAAALGFQLKSLHELNRQMAEEAGNLTTALKGQSKTQGSWGELVLERILEKCGLTKGV